MGTGDGRAPQTRPPAQAGLARLGCGGSCRRSPPRRCLGSETCTVSPAGAPAPIPARPPDEAAGSVGEKLGAQSRAARAQDKFASNRSVGAGASLLPGLRSLLARAWPPGSDSSSGRHGGCPHSTPPAVAGSMIRFSQVEKPLPKQSSGCPHSAEILQAAGGGGRWWPGSVPLTFLRPGSPTRVAGAAAGQSFSLALGEKLRRRRSKGTRRRLCPAPTGSPAERVLPPAPAPCSGPFRRLQITGERQTLEPRAGDGRGTDVIGGFFLAPRSSEVWLVRNLRISA